MTNAFKPNPGMLYRLMAMTNHAPADTIMVGDRESDQQAAANAGVAFVWAADFFKEI